MILDKILVKYPKKEDSLIEILLEYQATKNDNYISDKEIVIIAKYLGITDSKVCSVMSFYTLLSTVPKGKYIIQVCNNLSCHLDDDFNVLRTIENKLRIKVNETTKNKEFTLEFASCLGCCDEAPVIRIGDIVYTNLTKEKIDNIFSDLGCK